MIYSTIQGRDASTSYYSIVSKTMQDSPRLRGSSNSSASMSYYNDAYSRLQFSIVGGNATLQQNYQITQASSYCHDLVNLKLNYADPYSARILDGASTNANATLCYQRTMCTTDTKAPTQALALNSCYLPWNSGFSQVRPGGVYVDTDSSSYNSSVSSKFKSVLWMKKIGEGERWGEWSEMKGFEDPIA
jgi:hypothetical protein